MNCIQIEPHLTAYLLGDLTPEQKAVVETHLAGCVACRTELETLRATLEPVHAALADRGRQHPRIDYLRRDKIRRARPSMSISGILLRIAATLVIVFSIGVVVISHLPGSMKMQQPGGQACLSVDMSPSGANWEGPVSRLETIKYDDIKIAETKESGGKIAELGMISADSTALPSMTTEYSAYGSFPAMKPFSSGVSESRREDITWKDEKPAEVNGDTINLNLPVPERPVDQAGRSVDGDSDTPMVAFAPVMTKSPLIMHGLFGNRTGAGKAGNDTYKSGGVAQEPKGPPGSPGVIRTVGGEVSSVNVEGYSKIQLTDRSVLGKLSPSQPVSPIGRVKPYVAAKSTAALRKASPQESQKEWAMESYTLALDSGIGSESMRSDTSREKGKVRITEAYATSRVESPVTAKNAYFLRPKGGQGSADILLGSGEDGRLLANQVGEKAVPEDREVSKREIISRDGRVSTVVPPNPDVSEAKDLNHLLERSNKNASGETDNREKGGESLALQVEEPTSVSEEILVAHEYPPQTYNPIINTMDNVFSTFAIDVDTASFTMARRSLLAGKMPQAGAIRVEEFVNAFDYAYQAPERRAFAVYSDMAPSPFRAGLELLRIGVRGKVIGRDRRRSSVLTFVIDTSGSMNTPDRLGLIKTSLRHMVENLDPRDRVAIVTFGSEARLVLEHTPISNKANILKAIDSVQTYGSTHLESGLRLGYETAARNFQSGAGNRILLLSDGVANLGAATAREILNQVEQYRKQGIYCSVFGFGQGNYDDAMLETLADKGDGVYKFIDSATEARHAFVEDLAATLHVIARDVKIQVEFDPARVASYRLLGYENRHLTKEQFRDDTVDAGEVGSGQSATALYELTLKRGSDNEIIPFRADEIALGTVRVRWMDPENGHVEELAHPLRMADRYPSFVDASLRFRLAAGVAELADKLRQSPYATGTDKNELLNVLRPVGLELNLDQQVQDLIRMANAINGQ